MANAPHGGSRLETAVERLERAIATRAPGPSGAQADSRANDEAMAVVHAEIGEMKDKNKAVAARLDAAIGRVKFLLDQ